MEYARSLGFAPHPDFSRARAALGPWEGPSAITFGKDGKPYYLNGPNDEPRRVLATLERSVGRDGFDFVLSLHNLDELDGWLGTHVRKRRGEAAARRAVTTMPAPSSAACLRWLRTCTSSCAASDRGEASL